MFGRKIRTKIPQVCDFHIDDFKVHDRDSELKEKGKEFSYTKRGSTEFDISPGDIVIVKQTQNRNKINPTFRPGPMKVKAKIANSLTLDAMGLNTIGTLLMLKSSLKNMMTHRKSSKMMWNPKQLQMMMRR